MPYDEITGWVLVEFGPDGACGDPECCPQTESVHNVYGPFVTMEGASLELDRMAKMLPKGTRLTFRNGITIQPMRGKWPEPDSAKMVGEK